MTNEEIKALLRELAEKAEAEGETRSKTVRITFDPKKNESSDEPKERPAKKKEKRKTRVNKKAEKAPVEEAEKPSPKEAEKPSEKTAWKLPEEAPETETGTLEEDSFISVIPKERERVQPKRPEKYREGKKEPQILPESEDEPQEEVREEEQEPKSAKKRNTVPVEPPEYESDADFFTEDFLADGGDGKVWGFLAGAIGGIGSRIKDAAEKGREKARDAKEKRAAAKAGEHREEEIPESETDGEEEPDPEKTSGQEAAMEETAVSEPEEEKEAEKEAAPSGEEPAEEPAAEDSAAEGEKNSDGEEHPEEGAKEADGEEHPEDGVKDADGETEEAEKDSAPSEKVLPEPEEQAGEDAFDEDKEGFMQRLRDKGIAAKELVMIGAGAVLLILIAVMAFRLLGSRTAGRTIESDEGLTVKVVHEPGEWVNSGDVTLSVKAPGPIQSISINGNAQEFEGTDRTSITYRADDRYLELMVVCEEEVLTARTEFEWIDSNAPDLQIREEGGRISLEASDDLSGTAAIYYGEITGFSNVPAYRLYSQPFAPEEGVVYSCVAQDNAGNMSIPVVTDFSKPVEIRFAADEIHLFPGESSYVTVRTEPEHAYVSDLTLTNSDGSVIALEKNGRIRGIAEGTAKIQASAPGLQPASCQIEVRSEAELTITTVGDITLGDDENFNPAGSFTETYNANDSSYFFANVKSIFAADDLTFGNLEGTLTNQGVRESKEYAFRGDPSYTQILLDGSVEAVTLANNHSRDYGDVSLADTQKYLDEAGIAWCYGDKIAYVEAEGVKIGLIGIYVLADGLEREQQVLSTIREARNNGARLVVVAFHWGSEASNAPDDIQQTLAHLAIDNGADLVVGHHPHVLQGIELYKGKYIAYSLANFCFGGNSNPTDKDTMIFQQSFTVTQDGTITPGDIKIIPCSVSSESGRNNYQPTPATGTEQDRIMNRIREMSQQLGTQLP